MQLIDTHSHIDVDIFSGDRQEVLGRARTVGVIGQILPGICQSLWPRLLSLCRQEKDLYPAIGLHPMYLNAHRPEHLRELYKHAQSNTLVAIGEIGLDYYITVDRKEQQSLFNKQLDVAAETCLPILLHVRKAHDQVLSTLRKRNFTHGGIVHAFSGSMQQAEHYLKLGFLISFCGNITYKRAKKLQKIAKFLPLESIVLETDSPDLPPAAHNGERNSPEYLPEILETLSDIREESMEALALATTQNACRLLKLDVPGENSSL